jgi:exodeoxyribonuclease VII large subunit
VLERGFALVMNADGALIRSAATISSGDELRLKFRDGDVGAVATGGSAPAKPATKPKTGKQDDLFG